MTIRTQAAGRGARRVQAADRVKSGAAQRAYAKRKNRAGRTELPPMLRRTGDPMPRGRMYFVATIIALLGCGLAMTLLLTTRATEDSYQLGAARRHNTQLADEKAALQREVEAADSAPELAQRAAELGMIPAKDPARLVIGPDGQVIVVGTPTPAQGSPAAPLNTTPSAPSAQPKLSQAQGERVVPVTTTPNAPTTPANPSAPQNLAGQQNPVGQNVGGQQNPAAQNAGAPTGGGQNPGTQAAGQTPGTQNAAGQVPGAQNGAGQNAGTQNPAVQAAPGAGR
ncbi:hypothetical protein LTV02_34480 [Nocardia yamanashiensis]|uniref:hypothetical protein n=1 Tax=Nocardia yamanashiensis TaxID=209247 RepID=UPI001E4072C6|nr:hypothetical protein [Nocardia yamanashiensis]UGT41016.1 hypothetical protein LTV02_34480 [Nocardia yamanashiensis]